MTALADYAHAYRNLKFDRQDGVLTVTFHSDGGPLLWSAGAKDTIHYELPQAFRDIALDPDNHVVVLTGTGEVFCTGREPRGYGTPTIASFDDVYSEGKDILLNLLDIKVPVIAAVNGPVHIHADILILSDLIIASETAEFADDHVLQGLVPGDGAHVIWEMLLGLNRARAFLLTGERIPAREAKSLGLVHEVLPREQVLPRALEWAKKFTELTDLTRRYTRRVITQHLKERLIRGLDAGLLMEGFAYVDRAQRK